jgi:rSAM/selenodomain-associated transferase 1
VKVAIGVVAKAPVAGAVKTRMCPPCTPTEAAAVAAALLGDTVTAAVSTGHPTWCVATGDQRVLRAALPSGVPLLPQVGEGLGQRLANALAALDGDRVLLVGADCPTVDGAYLAAAVAALDEADVVLGPAVDGGYTLIGAHGPHPELFAGVPMSTPRVLAATVERARRARLSVRLLGVRHDIDTVEDLLAAGRAGQLAGAPRTRAALARLHVRVP